MPVTAAVAAAVAVAAAGALVVVVLLLIRIVADDIVPLCVARCLFTVEDVVFTAAKPSRTASAPEFQQIEDSGSLHCHSAVTPTVTRSTE